MKAASLLLLPLLASGAVIRSPSEEHAFEHQTLPVQEENPLEKRQIWEAVGNAIAPSLPSLLQWGVNNLSWILKWQSAPVKRDRLAPSLNPAAKKIKIRYGPYILRGTKEDFDTTPLNMDPKGTILMRTLKGLPDDSAILTAKTGLVYEDGSPAVFSNGVYVHHILIADMNKPTAPFAMCPGAHKEERWAEWFSGYIVEAVGAGLIQTGNDVVDEPNFYGTRNGALKSAFLTGLNDMYLMQAEIVNYNPTNKTVFLTMELEYLDDRPKGWVDSSTVVLSATGCAPPGYRPPDNSAQYNHTSKKFEIKQDGWIINTRGHLHDGGTAIELWLDDKMVCHSTPTYGRPEGSKSDGNETIVDMSWCYDPIRIKKGDSLVVKTYYDTKLHPLRPQAEGADHANHGGMSRPFHGGKGMEEMGIMTTNFAWDALTQNQTQADASTH